VQRAQFEREWGREHQAHAFAFNITHPRPFYTDARSLDLVVYTIVGMVRIAQVILSGRELVSPKGVPMALQFATDVLACLDSVNTQLTVPNWTPWSYYGI
jgi:hypothetical protein